MMEPAVNPPIADPTTERFIEEPVLVTKIDPSVEVIVGNIEGRSI
jgi:hypothetical protein